MKTKKRLTSDLYDERERNKALQERIDRLLALMRDYKENIKTLRATIANLELENKGLRELLGMKDWSIE